MAHSGTTTNYALPQFAPTDKPAWLTDINGAFTTIDTAIDAAKDAADAAQGDATQAITDAGNAGTAALTADAKGAGAVASIAPAFDPATIYAVGEKVMYNNLLYRCTVAVVTPGPWTGATNWERVTAIGLIPTEANQLPFTAGGISTYDKVNGIDGRLAALEGTYKEIKVKSFNGTTDAEGNLLIPDLSVLNNTILAVVLGTSGYCTNAVASGASYYVKVLNALGNPVVPKVNSAVVAYAIYL